MHQDATWYVGRPRPTRHCLRDFDVDQLLPEKRHTDPQPIFGLCVLLPNGWMDEDVAWYGNDLGPGYIVLDGFRAPAKVAQQTHSFRLMSIVATVAHLSYC